jgi:hypothetical protein
MFPLKMCLRIQLVVLSLVLQHSSSSATEYRFQKLYSSGDGLASFSVPSINDEGVVTFRARRDGVLGIFSGSGGELDKVVAVGDSFGETVFADLTRVPAINNEGAVVFKARLGTDIQGVFTGDGGSITSIADTSGTIRPNLVNDFGVPGINNSGDVVFAAGLDEGGSATFIGRGEAVMQVLGFAPSSPTINDSGRIAYGFRGDVFTKYDDEVVNLTRNLPRFSQVYGANINNSGAVAFAYFQSGVSGIAVADADGVNLISDNSGEFASLSLAPAINDQGKIAFLGNLDGTLGLFDGIDSLEDQVIVEGDPLFGSKLSSLGSGFYRHGFNNRGQFAFAYSLASGERGIAVATAVPEPGAVSALLLALLSFFGFRRKPMLIR